MQRKRVQMFRYGEADWDEDYLRWGFHDESTQLEEAESILHLVDGGTPLRILDIACGTGVHAVHWAEHGHAVTAVDISETFVAEGASRARDQNVSVTYVVEDIHNLTFENAFDVAVWIEKALYDQQCLAAIYRALANGGVFIQDIRNPEHPRTQAVTGDWERWREESGVYKLERHWNAEDGIHHDPWVDIDTSAGTITERTNECKAGGQDEIFRLLREAGFANIETRTMQGELFTGGEEPRWLWVVARKDSEAGT